MAKVLDSTHTGLSRMTQLCISMCQPWWILIVSIEAVFLYHAYHVIKQMTQVLHVVFARHNQLSIKSSCPSIRTKGFSLQLNEESPLPKQGIALKVAANKQQLIKLIQCSQQVELYNNRGWQRSCHHWTWLSSHWSWHHHGLPYATRGHGILLQILYRHRCKWGYQRTSQSGSKSSGSSRSDWMWHSIFLC